MLAIAATIGVGLVAGIGFSAILWLLTTVIYALADHRPVRDHLLSEINGIIHALSQSLRIDLPQFDARTKTQRNLDDAFMGIVATYHRET